MSWHKDRRQHCRVGKDQQGSLSHVPAVYTPILVALHSFITASVSGGAHLKDGAERIGCEATLSGRSDAILPGTPGWSCCVCYQHLSAMLSAKKRSRSRENKNLKFPLNCLSSIRLKR